MERSVNYSVVGRPQPGGNGVGEKKFYAQAQATGVLGLKEMADRIQRMCTVTRPDTIAVLVALCDVMRDGLMAGEIVRLGNMGSFQISVRSNGAKKEEDFHVSMIKKARINFRPGEELRDVLHKLSYRKVPMRKAVDALLEEPAKDIQHEEQV